LTHGDSRVDHDVTLSLQQDLPRQKRAPPVVLVTGGLSGIGAATAVAFARLGGCICLADLRIDRSEQVVDQVRAAGGKAFAIGCDVRDHSQVDAAVAAVVDRYGRLDVAVANAGAADQSSVSAGDPERWRVVVETNVLGVLYTVRAALPQMLERRSGHVFITASVSGREWYVGEPAYIASKWAQVGFGHALREEVRGAGVRVTLIEPGLVDTPLTRDNPVVHPLLEASTPLLPENVADAIVYAYQQPEHAVVSELTIRPLRQPTPHFE
jgi:NADP-dependent 3-hydroxy acid dehydrogenase YdfG